MYLFGCLPLLLIVGVVIALVMVGKGVALVGRILEMLGAIVMWLWGSFCNLFLPDNQQRRVYNPFTGLWNQEEPITMNATEAESPLSRNQKLYADEDGEYIDYIDLP